MKRVIYSLYIDIPDDELDYQPPFMWDNISKTNRTKELFKKHYHKLLEVKKQYSKNINVDFKMYEWDDQYKKYYKFFKENYPEITTYNIVNFYKIHLLYELAKEYDEILYLDFDVVPVTKDSFFDVWDLTKGICVLNNNNSVNKKNRKIHEIKNQSVRSPTAKYFNAQAMLIETGHSPVNDVINTGIIGINKEHLNQLNYFKNFREDLDLMSKLRDDKSYDLFPKNIVDIFGYDNETLFSYKLKSNNVNVQWLDNKWHNFYDLEYYIPKDTKLIHVINKRFEYVWRFYEKCDL
jgi:hypothetical protein